jgi:protein-tyrosine phosphatase
MAISSSVNEFPPLPSDSDDVRGPIATSNWVIIGKLIAGAYPGSIHKSTHQEKIRNIIQSGVTRFVCLLEEDERKECTPYENDASSIAAEYGRTISFDYYSIPDMRSADDESLIEFIPQLAAIVKRPDEVVYVHCWGGHGRTGIVISLLLVELYDAIDEEEALRLTELYHSKRVEARLHSPQTTVQFEQVRRVGKILLTTSRVNQLVLPSLPADGDDVRGPISVSNWVIPGKLIAGGYPGNIDSGKHMETIKMVVDSGVTCFVCLMQDKELERFRPYSDIAKQLSLKTIKFEYFPMPDGFIPKDESLIQFIPQLAAIVKRPDEVVYVHCWGGHGRTGIVISLLLVELYDAIDEEEALRLTELYHSKRVEARLHSPQTTVQFEQVRRVGKILLTTSRVNQLVLPSLPADGDDVRGPISVSNWVIPGKLIAGGYPGNIDSGKHMETIKMVVDSGVTCFVCLMQDKELERFRPYSDIAKQLSLKTIKFEYFPMPDGFIPKDESLIQFIPQLAAIVKRPDEVVYVHCWGGHGRTGIVISLLLVELYDAIDEEEALRLTELYHSKRVEARSHSPQTNAQISQVRRLSKILNKKD